MNKNTGMILAAVLIVVAAVAGFFGGIQYQKMQRVAFGNGQFGGGFAQGRLNGGQNSNFRMVRGQVLSMGESSLTVKLPDGSTRIVVLSGNTVFLKSATASLSDLKSGDTVNVVGSQNTDGSLTASDVQINPPLQQRPSNAPTGAK